MQSGADNLIDGEGKRLRTAYVHYACGAKALSKLDRDDLGLRNDGSAPRQPRKRRGHRGDVADRGATSMSGFRVECLLKAAADSTAPIRE